MSDYLLQMLLLAFPLAGFLVNGVLNRGLRNRKNINIAGGIGTFAVFASFIISVILFYNLQKSGEMSFNMHLFKWIDIENINIDFAFSFNRISALMCLIITGVGSLIHLFSIEYMKDDEAPYKYFAYLNLFIFNMLVLVLGQNLLISFIGWEGVGLCSYLLIGYWYEDLDKASAGMKAFIVNRIGDAGFLIGMIILYLNFGSLNYEVINELAPGFAHLGWGGVANAAALALFIGVAGKSAQFPLYVWLPDAMAGPTPVSALIHAATMVTAGVYVLFRLNGLLDASPEAMFVIASIGAGTAFVAAFVALTQWDIKKVLAYSTVSQLGYMVLAIGVGSYVGAVFHLLTHAFFKGLMFLGAGSVIHGLSGEQDMRNMGGLSKKMPITYLTFLMGWLSIIGAPFFAGFFSKDEILFHTFSGAKGSYVLWALGLITAGMTAFYMTRLMAKVFWGESKLQPGVHPHEGGVLFKVPLVLLAAAAVFSGFLGFPHIIGQVLPGHPGHLLADWLNPMLMNQTHLESSALVEILLMLSSVLVITVFSIMAYFLYVKKHEKLQKVFSYIQRPILVRSSEKMIYIDQFYKEKLVRPFYEVAEALWLFIDVNLLDKCIMSVASSIASVGKMSKAVQSGNLQAYVSIFIFVVAVFLVGVLFL